MNGTTLDDMIGMPNDNDPALHDASLDGNEIIEKAIAAYYEEESSENLAGVLDAIKDRADAGGHFLFPVLTVESDDSCFSFRAIESEDGALWQVAFTSVEEYELGEQSEVISTSVNEVLVNSLEEDIEGIVINPWGQSFSLNKDMIEMLAESEETTSILPDREIVPEDLEDGSVLRQAIAVFDKKKTEGNFDQIAEILVKSKVVVPCQVFLSDGADEALLDEGMSAEDGVTIEPALLETDQGDYLFPVFSSEGQMDDSDETLVKVHMSFHEALSLAQKQEKKVAGIIVDAFTEPFILSAEMFDLVSAPV